MVLGLIVDGRCCLRAHNEIELSKGVSRCLSVFWATGRGVTSGLWFVIRAECGVRSAE
jgi:hypothetical protein